MTEKITNKKDKINPSHYTVGGIETIDLLPVYRKKLGSTQSDMAKTLGISRQSYFRKENQLVPFTDEEKLMIKEMLIPLFPNITIDEIFLR